MDVIDNLSPRWTSLPEVVNFVLQNISAKDLRSCAQVCSLWRNLVRHIVKRRTQISWYFYASDEDDRSCETAFQEYVNNMAIEPKLALIFRTPPTINNTLECDGPPFANHCEYTEDSDLLKHLPLSCRSFFCMMDYVSGTTSDCKTTQTKHWKDGQALTAVFFPTLPGFEIYTFKLIDKGCETFHDHIGIPDNQIIKCFLLLLSEKQQVGPSARLLKKLVTDYFAKGFTHTAFGCKLIDEVTLRQRNSFHEEGSFGIAFTGDNISAAFVTVRLAESPADVEMKFKQLSETHPLQGQCIAFAFSDFLSRRRFLRNHGNGAVFRKLFPTIPLFTIFGCGGINFPFSFIIKKSNVHYNDFLSHKYKSVFIVMSFAN